MSQAVKGPQRGQQHSKKRIFQKKTSMEEREKDRGSLKMGKKYSYGIESEKEGAPTKSEKEGAPTKEHLSLSTKQIYTRRTMSPVKNTFSKHMVFNLAGKNLSNTSRK